MMKLDWNKICFTYLTVPEDISSQMIVNFQIYGPKPVGSTVQYHEADQAPQTGL